MMSDIIHWSTLTPGQRDMLVHRDVMQNTCTGKPVMQQAVYTDGSENAIWWYCATCQQRWQDNPPETHCASVVPPYTTSLDAAWLVVQKMAVRQSDDISFPSINEWFQAFLVQTKIWNMPPEKAADLICRGALELQGRKDGYQVVDE